MYKKNKDATFYFDMDNTILEWCPYGKNEEWVEKGYPLKKGFFENLKMFEGSDIVIKTLKEIGFDVKILSACESTPYCKPEKLKWLKKNLPFIKKNDIHLILNGETKSSFCKSADHILIDDYGKNLKEWHEKGGLAIKKSTSGKKKSHLHVIRLEEIFNVLESLGYVTKII